MNLQWILLAIFMVCLIKEILNAITRPMHRNVLNLVTIPVAFLITFVMQALGLFQKLATMLVNLINLTQYVGAEGSEFVAALLSTLVSPVLFLLMYWLINFLLRLIHVNLISKFIESKQIRKEKRLLKQAIREEKALVKDIVRSNEEEIIAIKEALEENGFDLDLIDDYDFLDEDDLEDMVDERVRREKRRRKRQGFFKESKEKKAVSIATAAVSGFLAMAIMMMPVFHTMSYLSDITSAIDKNDPENNFNKIYLTIDFIDEHLVTPYEESFVYQIYDSMGLADLMEESVKIGGKITVDGQEVYADDIVRNIFVNIVKVTTQLASNKPNPDVLRDGLNGIIKEPIVFTMIRDAFVKLMADQQIPDDYDKNDILSTIKYEIIRNYKQPVAPEEPKKEQFTSEEDYQAAMLKYQEELNVYNAELEKYTDMLTGDIEAMTDVIVALVEKELIKDLISGANDLETLLGDKDNIKTLLGTMSGLSVYDVVISGAFNSGIGMIGPFLGIPANKPEGVAAFRNQIVNACNNASDMTAEDIANVKKLFVEIAHFTKGEGSNNTSEGIMAYVADPLYKAEKIKDGLKELNDEFKKYEALANELSALQEATSLTPEQQERLLELLEEQSKLTEGKTLQQIADEMSAEVNEALSKIEIHVKDFQDRFTGFAPFIPYFLNWNGIQKPFMLSGTDTTSAPLTIVVDGTYYVCNTDSINLEEMLDFALNSGLGDTKIELPNESYTVDELLSVKVEDYITQIPMVSFIEKLQIKTVAERDTVTVSPVAELINFLIEKYADSSTIDMKDETLNSVLQQFAAINTNDTSYAETLANELIEGTFDYTGVTVERMHESLHFGDDWTDEHKKADSEKLVDVIFTIIDLIASQGEQPETMSDASGAIDEVAGESGDIEAMLGLLTTLGKTLDVMADTYCLQDLPKLMLEGLLKHEMLSIVMTPSMLNEFMNDMESEDFSYEQFMNDLVDRVTKLFDMINGEGGTEE